MPIRWPALIHSPKQFALTLAAAVQRLERGPISADEVLDAFRILEAESKRRQVISCG